MRIKRFRPGQTVVDKNLKKFVKSPFEHVNLDIGTGIVSPTYKVLTNVFCNLLKLHAKALIELIVSVTLELVNLPSYHIFKQLRVLPKTYENQVNTHV